MKVKIYNIVFKENIHGYVTVKKKGGACAQPYEIWLLNAK